jgi:alpha-tubulin suppressor-like RCC1 family protein
MIKSRAQVLASKDGFATVFVMGVMAIIIMFSVGVTMVNFSAQATLVSQTQNLTAAVTSRAEAYVGVLNQAPTAIDASPSTSAVTDMRTFLITNISSVVPAADGLSTTLTIKSVSTNGQFDMTRSVTLIRTVVTHIVGFDSENNPIWTKADEANQYSLWSIAEGSIRPLTVAEREGAEKNPTTWKWGSDRLGIDSTNHLRAWSDNSSGQTGTGSSSNWLATPAVASPSKEYRSAESDGTSAFAIDMSGKLWSWGDNSAGKLGTGNTQSYKYPTAVNSSRIFTSVTSHYNTSFGLDNTGRLWGWGQNWGRLAIGSNPQYTMNPTRVVAPSGTSFTSVQTANGSTFAISTDGTLWAWGENDSGQLGLGYTSSVVTDVRKVSTAAKFTSVSSANKSAAAVDTTGKIWAWGKGGQVGDGTWTASATPKKMNTSVTFSSVSVGWVTTYAIDSYGRLHAWGSNDQGQYGNGNLTSSASPVQLMNGVRFSEFWANPGSKWSTGIDANGGLWSFGHAGTGSWWTDYATDVKSAVKMPSPNGFVQEGWN